MSDEIDRAVRICVLGSANMDLVVDVDRAPDAGETVAGRSFSTFCGGKGANQAIAAARAGADVTMFGAVGADAHGVELLDTLAAAGVDTAGIERVSEPTGTAHIVVDAAGGNRIVVVPGANGTVGSVPPALAAALAEADALLLQLELPIEAVVEAARAGRDAGARVVLTPAPARPLPPELLASIDLLVPNQHEAALLTPAGVDGLTDLVPAVVVTLGGSGATWVGRDADPVSVPAFPVPVRDTTAAGDTFVGALAVALGEGHSMPDALVWANAAAAVSVQRAGAAPSMPTRSEIDALAGW